MEKVSYYIKSALELLLVQASEQPVQQEEAQDSIRKMNDMMLEIESSGLPLGYTEVSDLGDDVTVPDYSRRMVIYNLAIQLGPAYDVPITADVRSIAAEAMESVERIVIKVPFAIYPDTLPVGGGNDCGSYDRTFYPGEEDGDIILEESPGSILLEEGTEDDS